MNKWILLCLGIVLLVMSAACTSKPQATTATPATSARTPASNTTVSSSSRTTTPVTTSLPTPAATVQHVTAVGLLSFVQDVKLMFGTSGQVAQVSVKELDRVTQGQVLAKLDTTSLEEALKAVQLAEKSAEFARDQASYSVLSAETDNNTVQENVKSAGVDLEQAQDNLNKIIYPYNYHTVYIDVPTALGYINDAMSAITSAATALKTGQYGDIPSKLQQALDSLTSSHDLLYRSGPGTDPFENQQLSSDKYWTLRTAEFQMEKAQVAVENAQNTANKTAVAVETAKTALAKANNDVDIAQNNVKIANDTLQKAIIIAPSDGVIAAVNIKELDLLSSANYATTTAIEIIDPSRMELDVNVNELDITNVKLGQNVTISVNAIPGMPFNGIVTSISTLPMAESGPVSYEVKAVFDVPHNSTLKAGMTATADIVTDKR